MEPYSYVFILAKKIKSCSYQLSYQNERILKNIANNELDDFFAQKVAVWTGFDDNNRISSFWSVYFLSLPACLNWYLSSKVNV